MLSDIKDNDIFTPIPYQRPATMTKAILHGIQIPHLEDVLVGFAYILEIPVLGVSLEVYPLPN